jgi:CDGSH-type Zn-finger protein/uncharacterized Fe-S cluster protein YjdI
MALRLWAGRAREDKSMPDATMSSVPSREQLIHTLYEAAELEHNLMCTYLYAAFSLKTADEGLSAAEAEAVKRWRGAIIKIAAEEMGHLVAVWNITSALGGAPRVGRANFPLDGGYLPAGVVVKLAPFNERTLQHFIHLERPMCSSEPDGEGYAYERAFTRGVAGERLTPMAFDYATVGEFYALLTRGLTRFVDAIGEDAAFCGDREFQLSESEVDLGGAKAVICIKTALKAFDAIVTQGEGASEENADSHFCSFRTIRDEFERLKAANPDFTPAHPAATNPVLRRPPNPEGRVWLENEAAIATVDLANAAYGLMLRLLSYAYATPRGQEKSLAVDLAVGLMRAVTPLAERAARLEAGPSNPGCNAGMSFTALRDSGALPPSGAAWRFFNERFDAFTAASLAVNGDARLETAARHFAALAKRCKLGAHAKADQVQTQPVAPSPAPASHEERRTEDGVEYIEGEKLTLIYEGKRCIHSRFCVTWAPKVFLANVEGPWIHPDAMDEERVAEIAHLCVSGAIRYQRKDSRPEESKPPVNLIQIREGGPYGVRANLVLDGEETCVRATLCRCGASKNKPFCDSSHHEVHFDASGEPETGANGMSTEMLAVRDGPLQIDPQIDGPLHVRGNLEIISGTGRMVARMQNVKLCRCGQSSTKPYCDGTHAKIGFKST